MLTTQCYCEVSSLAYPHSHRPDLDCPTNPTMEPTMTARSDGRRPMAPPPDVPARTTKQPAMPELADWTDEVINETGREVLVSIIKANPDSFTYGVRKVVFHMELVGEIFGTGLLGKIDSLGSEFLKILAKEDPEVKQSYGKIEFSIYEDESTLRYRVRDQARQARKDRELADDPSLETANA